MVEQLASVCCVVQFSYYLTFLLLEKSNLHIWGLSYETQNDKCCMESSLVDLAGFVVMIKTAMMGTKLA